MIADGHVVIVGASLAGLRSAEAMRREGFDGDITLLGDEDHLPYNRPALSKGALVARPDVDSTALTTREKLAGLSIGLRTAQRAVALDLVARRLELADGTELAWDGLVIATGARARRLPGSEHLRGVLTLRTFEDAQALHAELAGGTGRVVVCGAGFIGAEVASAARALGREVTVVEAAATPLAHLLGQRMGTVLADLMRDHGVELITGVGVEGLEGDGHVRAVVLADGRVIDAGLVVVGIGAIPNTEWLEGSGIGIDDGVLCDAACRAAPDVVAAGDVARWPNLLFDGESMRVEHWENAALQAGHAARTLLAGDCGGEPFAPVPWFWSNQFGVTIQMAGRPRPTDDVEIVAGAVEEGAFAAIWSRRGELSGVFAVNEPGEVARQRSLLAERRPVGDARHVVV